jgi:hypothetical protein
LKDIQNKYYLDVINYVYYERANYLIFFSKFFLKRDS